MCIKHSKMCSCESMRQPEKCDILMNFHTLLNCCKFVKRKNMCLIAYCILFVKNVCVIFLQCIDFMQKMIEKARKA